jgi:hypothetical protein
MGIRLCYCLKVNAIIYLIIAGFCIFPPRFRPFQNMCFQLDSSSPSSDSCSTSQPDNEVVQLKFLQKSNKDQINKLFDLLCFEPLVVHYYLEKTIFPGYMRSQRMKISASGQSVGGDMLARRRVGFSGTPSDLLPKELGRCDYETGDDGMMLTTMLNRAVASYEFISVRPNIALWLHII